MIDETELLATARYALRKRLLDMNFSSAHVSLWVNGHRKPNLEQAVRIESVIGIPAAAWLAGVPLREMWAELTRRSE